MHPSLVGLNHCMETERDPEEEEKGLIKDTGMHESVGKKSQEYTLL